MPSSFNALDADAYDAFMGRWSRVLAAPFLEFAGIAAEQDILDVGCGTGSLLGAIIARKSPRTAVGIDFSKVFAEKARQRLAGPGVTIDVGDACALPYSDDAFDAALSLLVLHFVPAADQAIAEMRRVARPGGRVAAAVWDSFGGMPNQRMFWDTAAALDPDAERSRTAGYWRPMVRPGELGRAFAASGLENVEERELHIRMEYTDFDDFWWPIAAGEGALGKYCASLDPPRQDRLTQAVRAAFEAGEPDGPRSFTATAWACRGTVPRGG